MDSIFLVSRNRPACRRAARAIPGRMLSPSFLVCLIRTVGPPDAVQDAVTGVAGDAPDLTGPFNPSFDNHRRVHRGGCTEIRRFPGDVSCNLSVPGESA
jgi:hypothetical protein